METRMTGAGEPDGKVDGATCDADVGSATGELPGDTLEKHAITHVGTHTPRRPSRRRDITGIMAQYRLIAPWSYVTLMYQKCLLGRSATWFDLSQVNCWQPKANIVEYLF